jgi:hypothetical protein
MVYDNKTLEYMDVIWKDVETRRNFKIGVLSKNGKYTFTYHKEGLEEAKARGFKGLIAFPDFEAEYTNEELFPVFEARLPDKRRKDLPYILESYNLNEYDVFELLKKTEGKTPTDTLSFVEPIILYKQDEIVREFYIVGIRHCDICDGLKNDKCTVEVEFEIGENLELVPEKNNIIDEYAVGVFKGEYKVGYIPIYYSKQVTLALEEGYHVKCIVKHFDSNKCCQECLRVLLNIKK